MRLRRLLAIASATVGLCAALPALAGAATTGPVLPSAGQVRGTVLSLDWSTVTIRTGGRTMSTLSALGRAADAVTAAGYPYVYGGGHEHAGTASIGIKGPGYNGRRIGYDCSGSVAAVLAGANLWPAGTGVPADNGVIAQLRQERLIAPGVGTVTLYDKPGVHIFMSIGGRYFGTSAGAAGSPLNPRGGAGWLSDDAPDVADRHYKRFHLLPGLLQAATIYGPTLTFSAGSDPELLQTLQIGQTVRVSYRRRADGTLLAGGIS